MPLIRTDKFLAHMGAGTRNEIKALLKSGRVKYAGKVIKDGGLKIPENSVLELDGKTIGYSAFTYIMLNKPSGVISATEDKKDKTVIDLLTEPYSGMDLFPAGRLDKDTLGLIILTNDGEFAHNSLAPKKHVKKTYYVEAEGSFPEEIKAHFKNGILLEDNTKCKSADLHIIENEGNVIKCELTITEGKFHQIKRMFAAEGGRVTYLKRISFGKIELDPQLKEGSFRPLNDIEMKFVEEIKNGE